MGFDWKLVTYWTMGLWGFPLASACLLGGVLFCLCRVVEGDTGGCIIR